MGGNSKRRREAFFRKHPICCFCGGGVLATTEDHWPGRLFFKGRRSPKGFVFPACQSCNSLSRDTETIIRLIAVSNHHDHDDHERWLKSVDWAKRNRPDIISSMRMDDRQKRIASREIGLFPPRGVAYRDLPFVNIEAKIWKPHLDTFARKLILALHYRLFSKPLGSSGALSFVFQTNTSIRKNNIIESFSEIADNIEPTFFNRENISDQFSIRWSGRNSPNVAVWLVHLHARIFFFAISADNKEYATIEGRPLFGCF